MLLDEAIRDLALPMIRERHPDAFTVHELSLFEGRTRLDLAAVYRGICGFEIKSAKDNTKRLRRNQAEKYSRVCRQVTIFVSKGDLWRAKKIIPKWWEIVKIVGGHYDEPELEIVREGEENPNVDPEAFALCFWREELLKILGLPKRHGAPKEELGKIVSESLSLEEMYGFYDQLVRYRPIRDNRWAALHGVG